jgi:hypothetical protein
MRTKKTRVGFVILAALAFSPEEARADRAALTLEFGGSLRLGSVSPSIGNGENVTGTLAGPWLGLRYALTNRLELGLSGFWDPSATFVNQAVTLPAGSGSASGALAQDVSRWGAAAGVRYVLAGSVWRIPAGLEVGWVHTSTTNRDLLNTSDPRGATSFGLTLGDGRSDQLLLAPLVGVEWLVTDHLSFSLVPRFEFLAGAHSTFGVVVPLTIGWSWYLL